MNISIKALIFDIGGVLFFPKENGREKHLLSSFKEACLLAKNFDVNALNHWAELFDISAGNDCRGCGTWFSCGYWSRRKNYWPGNHW